MSFEPGDQVRLKLGSERINGQMVDVLDDERGDVIGVNGDDIHVLWNGTPLVHHESQLVLIDDEPGDDGDAAEEPETYR